MNIRQENIGRHADCAHEDIKARTEYRQRSIAQRVRRAVEEIERKKEMELSDFYAVGCDICSEL